jgi:hypothetical protein
MFPADIQDFASLSNKDSQYLRKFVLTITSPSDDDIGKLLDVKRDNTLRWLCWYKTVENQKFLYLQGGLIFKEYTHNQTLLKLHLWTYTTLFLRKGYENQIVQYCAKDFNQGKDNTTLVYDDGCTKISIHVKIPEEYGALTQLLTEDKIKIYEICENYPHIYQTYYKALERITSERVRNKKREIPEVNWIYGHPGLGKIEFTQDSLKTYDLMKKHDFVYTRLRSHKNIIYDENVTNNERLKTKTPDKNIFR